MNTWRDLDETWSFRVTIAIPFHVPIQYNSIKTTLTRNNFNLMLVLRYFHFQILDKITRTDLMLYWVRGTISRNIIKLRFWCELKGYDDTPPEDFGFAGVYFQSDSICLLIQIQDHLIKIHGQRKSKQMALTQCRCMRKDITYPITSKNSISDWM